MPNDRIDQMSHDELKQAARALYSAVQTVKNVGVYADAGAVDRALDAFNVSTLDKVRELLKAEGWRQLEEIGGLRDHEDVLEIWNRRSSRPSEIWQAGIVSSK